MLRSISRVTRRDVQVATVVSLVCALVVGAAWASGKPKRIAANHPTSNLTALQPKVERPSVADAQPQVRSVPSQPQSAPVVYVVREQPVHVISPPPQESATSQETAYPVESARPASHPNYTYATYHPPVSQQPVQELITVREASSQPTEQPEPVREVVIQDSPREGMSKKEKALTILAGAGAGAGIGALINGKRGAAYGAAIGGAATAGYVLGESQRAEILRVTPQWQ